MDFGLKEFGLEDESEMLWLYRGFAYEKRHIKVGRFSHRHTWTHTNMADRLRYRTRYFTDSGIMGTEAFVAKHYQVFKQLFSCKH